MKSIPTTLVAALTISVALTGLGGYVAMSPADNAETRQPDALPKASFGSKTVEYTLMAENTTIEIAPDAGCPHGPTTAQCRAP